MDITIWQYAVSLLYVGGLLIVLIRYHHTHVLVPGFWGFVFLLMAPYIQRWLLAQPAGELLRLRIMLSRGVPLLGIYLILVSLVKITHAERTRASSLYRMVGLVFLFFVFAGIIFFAILNKDTLLLRVNYHHIIYHFLAGAGFLMGSVAVFSRFSVRWFGIAATVAFVLLSLMDFLFLGAMTVGLISLGFLWDFSQLVMLLAWIVILVFFITVPRDEVDSYPTWVGFGMTPRRWGGVVAVVIGSLVCAWQIYEVNSSEHFTFWMVGGFIPLPVMLLGILVVLGGLIRLVRG
jgi:hypothetical protein